MTRFDAQETLRLIEAYRIDWLMMVPTMMHRIWRLGEDIRNRYDLSCLRLMVHLAAPCPRWLKQAWIDWLGADRIYEIYGGSEAQGGTAITGEEWLSHKGSVGKAYAGCRVKVAGENGRTLEPGQVGEVYMLPDEGPGSTYRYVGAQAHAIGGGWESLGDMGWMDEEGYLYLTDRKTDMIVSGGANIYPAEVEAAIDAHPAVRSSAVIGLPDDDLGKVVHAVVDAPQGITEDQLLAHLSKRLVRYKIPRSFEFASTPLRDEAGKVRRFALVKERTKPSAV
jgi:bile acid-coenzyme A ligase